ncbi:MAG: hypothetical protein QXQ41_04935 [Candidatus Bathyarchaeia archaeon]
MRPSTLRRFKGDRKAASPTVSTVIITGAIVTLLLTVTIYTYDFLDQRIAENEFATMKQFMQNTALQIDDVAWIPGKTQTIRYASRAGHLAVLDNVIHFTVKVDSVELASVNSAAIMFNIPISKFTLGNNYYEQIFPQPSPSGSVLLYEGVSATTGRVFVVEKIPMDDGNYLRIVAVPSIRYLISTLPSASGGQVVRIRVFLPTLKAASNHPMRSQSMTLSSINLLVNTTRVNGEIEFEISFPQASRGFDSKFFFNAANASEPFKETLKIDDIVPDQSNVREIMVEFYVGEVLCTLGLHG